MIKKATNVQYSYIISGNGIQNGNPSPSNILPFDGCGDRTDNLFDIENFANSITDTRTFFQLAIMCYQGNTFIKRVTFSGGQQLLDIKTTGDKQILFNVNAENCTRLQIKHNGSTKDIIIGNVYGTFSGNYAVSFDCSGIDPTIIGGISLANIMLNSGSTALPYEPYGHKLDISSRGENLFDEIYPDLVQGQTVKYKPVYVGDGNFTLSTDYPLVQAGTADLFLLPGNVSSGASTVSNGVYFGQSRTFSSVSGYVTIGYRKYSATHPLLSDYHTMLNKGSTPLPYEPYIEPIEVDIYLGQVQTTRNIKKLVLTGEEDWSMPYTSIFRLNLNGYLRDATNIVVCTHYKGIAPVGTVDDVGMNETALLLSSSGNNYFYIHDSRTNLATFTTYLQQQYAAGTPVTVWYVLATPEVSIVNEPLMKIGNYVDTINNTQSGIDITTNNLTVTTTIPPSDISINTTATWVPIPYNKNNTETISTIAPIDFLSNGQNITVGLKGNAEQLEIPSPDNPIMAEGTGERTGNLFDISNVTHQTLSPGGTISAESAMDLSGFIEVNGDFTVSWTAVRSGAYMRVSTYDTNKNYIERLVALNTYTNAHYSNSHIGYIRINYENSYGLSNIMLNTGSSPLPYEPYGYKIPISSAGQTTPVYLGEVETTRKIKKLVLDGTENWKLSSTTNQFYMDTVLEAIPFVAPICTHFKGVSSLSADNQMVISATQKINIRTTYIQHNLTDWINYLQQQYAAGTPVTVWYVLATSTTGIVNEPLMRIGNYADEISNITIPTTKGSNTLSVTTSVQPSNVQLSISGWVPHNNIKEYKNNAWMATSWEGFRDIVRAGNGPTRYPIGTKLYETWGDNTSNAWIIVDYDNSNYNDPDISALGYTHNVVLYEEKINYPRQFDAKEAWLYVETAIPAGTYRFSIPNYDTSYGGGKTYIFTSTTDVPVGGQLTLTWDYNTNPTKVQAYSSSTSTTALFDVTITEWDTTTACVDLGTIKLAMSDPDSTYGKLNHIHRARYGSNNYYQSGIRQWLNADATANNWWKPTNIFDRPYSNRNTDGRLYLMDEDFRKVIAAPNITCITNNIFETGTSGSTAFKLQTQYTIRDKIFLPTHTELNLSSNPNIGTVFSQYTNAGNDDRIKYRKDNGNAYYYWFRTPYPSIGYSVRSVYSSGALNRYSAITTLGAVRACIIQ